MKPKDKTKYLSVRCSPRERRELERLANSRHQTLSQYVRMAIDERKAKDRAKTAAA